jgi:hypothetical protein
MKRAVAGAAFVLTSVLLADCRRPETVVVEESPPANTAADHTGHYWYNGHWYADSEHTRLVQ